MQKNTLNKICGLLPVILVLLMLVQGCASSKKLREESARNLMANQTQPVANTDSLYRIRIGDEIELLVWEQPNFNTTTTVSSLGTIAIPLVGEVKATGLTHDELKRELTRKLSQYIKDEINLTLSIRSTDNMLVSVFGMVTRPDNYPVVNETSIFKILSVAGGPSDEANIRSVKIYRKNNNPHYVTVDLTKYLDSGELNSPATTVYPGDIVYVPKKENAVREMSDFLRDVVLLFGIFRVIN